MTYAYDDYVLMPTKDLYDTAVMKMAIEAAKDMYDRGQALMENFYKTYGDFMSPFAEDMKTYGAAMNNVRQVVNDAYARGIDLFKSPEGRAIVAQLTHSIDPGWYNRARQNAKVGYAYLDALHEAKLKGTYDPAYEDWILNQKGGPGSFANFSSKKGMWTVSGPSVYKDPNTLVSPLFENIKDDYIDTVDGWDISGVSRDRRALILLANLGALLKTPEGKYQYEISKAKAEKILGHTPSQEEILTQYENDLLDASDRFEHRTVTENKDWARRRESQLRMQEDDHRSANDERVYLKKASVDYKYKTLDMYDKNRDEKIDENEQNDVNGNYGDKTNVDIIRDSYNNPGTSYQYNPADPYTAKVAPVDSRIQFIPESKKGSGDAVYVIPNEAASRNDKSSGSNPSSILYRYDNGTAKPMDRGEMVDYGWFSNEGEELVEFIPNGTIITLRDENGNNQPFMVGKINATGETCLMKVKSNKHDYNKNK